MGNTTSRRVPLDKALLEPTYQVYSDTGSWELSLLKSLVQSGKLAPFYPPHSELPLHAPNRISDQQQSESLLTTSNAQQPKKHTTTTTTITSSTTPEKQLATTRPISSPSLLPSPSTTSIESTPSHHSTPSYNENMVGHNNSSVGTKRPSSLWLSKFKRTQSSIENQSADETTGESQPPRPLEHYFDECPICMMYYQGGMNTAKCCSQRICSECYLQICRGGPKHAESNSICPFCKATPFKIQYTGPKNWKQRCKELEEEQRVIQLKIKHDREEQLQQEEERSKRISESLNNSTSSFTTTSSTVTTNAPINASFSVNSTTPNSPQRTMSPSNNNSQHLSGIAFLESYFANRREETNALSMPQSSSLNNTPSMQNRNPSSDSNSDPLFMYLFGNNASASSSPRHNLRNNAMPPMTTSSNNSRPSPSDRDDTLNELMRYFSLGRVPTEAAGPINHSSSYYSSQHASTRDSSSVNRPSRVPHSRSPPVIPSPLSDTDSDQGLPAFSDFIPQTVDVTNVNADDEMLNEAIRLSLLEQQQVDNFSTPQVVLHREPPNPSSSLGLSPITSSIAFHTIPTSYSTNSSSSSTPNINSSTLNDPNTPLETNRSTILTNASLQVSPGQHTHHQQPQLFIDDEDDAELQLVLRLSILDQ